MKLLFGKSCIDSKPMLALCLLVVLVLVFAQSPLRAEPLEVAFWNRTPELLKYFDAQKYDNVGVLKFHIQTAPNAEPTHTVGSLNYNAARRLEAALILRLGHPDTKRDREIMIIRDATTTAANTANGNHLTAAGRLALIAKEVNYAPSWGVDQVRADALVTGNLTIQTNLRTIRVQLRVFDKQNTELRDLLSPFDIDMTTDSLIEVSRSFRHIDLDKLKQLVAAQQAQVAVQQVQQAQDIASAKKPENNNKQPPPAVLDILKDAPVELTVFYDDKPIDISFVNGEYFLAPPIGVKKVDFGLVRKDQKSNDKYGVVLMVNGISTLDMERKPATQCRRWVLPKSEPLGRVSGFYKDGTFAPIAIVPPSKDLQTEYKDSLGTVSFTILKEGLAAVPDLNDDQAQTINSIVHAADFAPPKLESVPRSLTLLHDRLTEQAQALEIDRSRGIMIPSRFQKAAPLQVIDFRDPGVIMSVNIRYYQAN